MAQRILGVDLGAYSVKVVELEVGFRQSKVRLVREKKLVDAVPGPGGPSEVGTDDLERQARTLRAILDELDHVPDAFALALGEDATLRVVEMPFQDARKIDQVIGYELESQILGELDGLVVDQVMAEPLGDGARVLAVGVDRERLQRVIDVLAQQRAEPRYVGAAVLSYAALCTQGLPALPPAGPVAGLGDDEEGRGPARSIDAVVDLGHRGTRVAFLENGRTLFARSISRGGADVTTALADTYRLEEAAAERAKHAQAQLLADPDAAPDPARHKLDSVLRDALRPLLRELRQTFSAARAQGAPEPRRLLLTGGAARLGGLPQWLSSELAIPLARLALPVELVPSELGRTEELPAIALGTTFGVGLTSGTQVNLRKGTLAYRNDYSYLRGKASSLAVAAVTVLACLALNAYSSLSSMRKESDVLQARLKRETKDLFGDAKTDGKAVSEELRRGPQSGSPPVPSLTAFDLLDEITRHLPPKDQLTIDILELDIKPKKTFIKATAASGKEIDTLVEALKQIDCFGDIATSKVIDVLAPSSSTPDGGTPAKLKQFTLTIETTCQ